MKLIVIGGVAAGMSAAAKLKRMNRDAKVVVYEKGDYLSYGACGLPYYVSGENNDHTKMIARTKEEFEEAGMDIFTQHEVVKVSPERKQVMVKNLENGDVFIDSYDKLMIATGAIANKPPFPGMNLNRIEILKTMENGLHMKEVVEQNDVQNVVIVGGGYIGIEVVEAMRYAGKNVTLIEHEDRILTNFDEEITEKVTKEMKTNEVTLRLGEAVESFEGDGSVTHVLTNKDRYPADLVVIAVGVKPATKFLEGTGIHLAKNGAIIIDREMRTNVEDIYAAGDCAEVYHKVMQENAYIPLGTTANKCGRIAGANIAGEHQKYIGTLGSAAIKAFNLEVGRTGLSEADAKRLAIDYTTTFIESTDHPAYYPDATPIWIKLISEKGTKRLLGAQAVGNKGVVLRIDVLAVAIHQKMAADELGMVDLCYAPPFAGVWDAIHIASNAVKE